MGTPIFRSDRSGFFSKNDAFLDIAKQRMVATVEVAIKTTAGTPVKTGGMKSEVRSYRNDGGGWRVEAGKEYSAVQERGRRLSGKGAPTAQFTHYSTSGTKWGWFQRAIDGMLRNRDSIIQEARRAVGL